MQRVGGAKRPTPGREVDQGRRRGKRNNMERVKETCNM